MILTEEEKKLVLRHREDVQRSKERAEKKRTCKHDWTYRGEWRGDSFYECFKCGATKSE